MEKFQTTAEFLKKYYKGFFLLVNVMATLVLSLMLLRLSWIDFRTCRLPDVYTLPLIAAGVCLSLAGGGIDLFASLVGGVVGYALFWAIGHFYFQRHKIEGLGLGDAKLFAASGTWLGYAQLPYVLLVASITGLLISLALRKKSATAIAFGPWLALGFFSVWIWGIVN